VGERELEAALVAMREPTRPEASAPLEPVVHRAGVRRRRANVVRSVAVVLAVVIVGGGLVRLAGGAGADRDITTEGPGLRFGTVGPASAEQLERTAAIVKNRLDRLGRTGVTVTVEDGGIVVRGAADDGQLARAVAPSVVSFRPVLAALAPETGTTVAAVPSASGTEVFADERQRYEVGPSDVDGSVVESASAVVNAPAGSWTVLPVLRAGPDGIDRFNALVSECFRGTERCPTRRVAIVVGDRVLSAPEIQAASFHRDQIEISGSFTEDSARELADLINLGNQPETLRPT
jgi:hypothetical protein